MSKRAMIIHVDCTISDIFLVAAHISPQHSRLTPTHARATNNSTLRIKPYRPTDFVPWEVCRRPRNSVVLVIYPGYAVQTDRVDSPPARNFGFETLESLR